jgi:hypothetical protein
VRGQLRQPEHPMSNAFRELAKQRPPQEPDRNPVGCWASHCPCRGSVSLEGGKFLCSAHACVPSDKWPAVTEKLHQHSWLIELIDDIQRMDHERDAKLPDWRVYATKFWEGTDEHCIPDPKEDAIPYQNRLRGELLYRCGLAKRPSPRLPQIPKKRGNAASFLKEPA